MTKQELKANDIRGEVLVGPEKHTTIRQHMKDEYGHADLDAVAVARDFDVLDRVRILLIHRGYDDPIVIRENEDGHDVIVRG